jgi:hypothetical protein
VEVVVSFTTRTIYLKERAPATAWIGGWVGLRIFLVNEGREKCTEYMRGDNFPVIL